MNLARIGRTGIFLFGVGWMILGASPAHSVTIEEYLTPTADSSPTGIDVGPDGHIWFTEINADKIGRLDPSNAEPGTAKGIVEYDLPEKNSRPNDLIVARDGTVWFSEMQGNRIGRLDPTTGEIREYPVPTPGSEPHNLAEADDGAIWFLEFETNKVARLDPGTGDIVEYPVNEGHPHDLVLRGDRVWYSQGGKFWAQIFFSKLGALDPESGKVVQEIPISPEKAVPHGMDQGADGTIWFTQLFANKIAKLDFSGGNPPDVVEYRVPGERSKGPHDLIVDDDRGWVWMTLNRADSIGRLDLSRAQPGTDAGLEVFPTPTAKSHPNGLALDAEGNVWFTEMGHFFMGRFQNRIGKVVP